MAYGNLKLTEADINDPEVRSWYKKNHKSAPGKILPPPTILQLEVTKNCNFACIMCHKGQMPEGKDFVRTDLSEIARYQIRPAFPHLKYAMLFGDGEPMVYPHFWDIVKEIRDASPECAIDFINNGSMMHEKNREKLLDYKVNLLGLSLGGARAESHNFCRPPGMFDKIVENFMALKHEKKVRGTREPYITAHMVVMQCNFRELVEFVDLCSMLDIVQINLQKLFVTHPMVDDQQVEDSDLEPFLEHASQRAKKRGLGFIHYPLSSGKNYKQYADQFHSIPHQQFYDPIDDAGYCLAQQPWNTIYVLHDGKVVPDCHWWTSKRETGYNVCGTLDAKTNILDIWQGDTYNAIRDRIRAGKILPQCRGCGVTGGVVESFRSADTDHTDPRQEDRLVNITVLKPVTKMSKPKASTGIQKIGLLKHCGAISPSKDVSYYYNSVQKWLDSNPPRTFNMGDLIAFEATIRLLKTNNFVYDNNEPGWFSDCDYLVMRSNNCLWDDRFGLTREFVDSVPCPILLLGVGCQIEQGLPSKETISALQAIAERSPICVRESLTAQILEDRGVDNIVVVGCPTMYLQGQPQIDIRPADDGNIVVPFRSHLYGADTKMMLPFLEKFADRDDWCLLSQGGKEQFTVCFPEGTAEARLNEIYAWFKSRLGLRKEIVNKLVGYWNVDGYRQCVKSARLVVGYRLHAALLALGYGIPSFLITYDSRSRSFCDEFLIPHCSMKQAHNLNVDSIARQDWSGYQKEYTRGYFALQGVLDKLGIQHTMN